MTATGPPPLSSAEETHASHEVMELVRSDLDLSLLVIQLREVGKSWREVKAAIEATISRRAPQVPPCGLQMAGPMHKLRFALLSVAFIALAVVVYPLQAGSALHQWLTGRARRTFRITLLGPRAKRNPRGPGA